MTQTGCYHNSRQAHVSFIRQFLDISKGCMGAVIIQLINGCVGSLSLSLCPSQSHSLSVFFCPYLFPCVCFFLPLSACLSLSISVSSLCFSLSLTLSFSLRLSLSLSVSLSLSACCTYLEFLSTTHQTTKIKLNPTVRKNLGSGWCLRMGS